MLVVTRQAEQALLIELGMTPEPAVGVRIFKDVSAPQSNGTGPHLQMALVTYAPPDDDLVVSPIGIEVFIDRDIASLVQDHVLDQETDDMGQRVLVLKAS
jgi:Fe-S cluster assembly iron-binding protein IscA